MTAGMFGGILLRVLRKRSRLAASLPAVFDTMDAPGGIARVVATHQDKGRDPNDARMLLIVWVLSVFVLFGRMRLFWTSAVTRHLVDGLPPLTRAKSSHAAWWLVGERLLLHHYGKWSALPGKEIQNVKRGRTTSTVNPKRLAAYHDSRIREEVREEFMRVCDEVTRDGLIAPGFAWKK